MIVVDLAADLSGSSDQTAAVGTAVVRSSIRLPWKPLPQKLLLKQLLE